LWSGLIFRWFCRAFVEWLDLPLVLPGVLYDLIFRSS